MNSWPKIAVALVALVAVIIAIRWLGEGTPPVAGRDVGSASSTKSPGESAAMQPGSDELAPQQGQDGLAGSGSGVPYPAIETYEAPTVMTEIGPGEGVPGGVTSDAAQTAPPPADASDQMSPEQAVVPGYIDPRSPEASGSSVIGPAPEAYDSGAPGVAPEMSGPAGVGITGDPATGVDPSLSGPGVIGGDVPGLPPEAYDPGMNTEPPEESTKP